MIDDIREELPEEKVIQMRASVKSLSLSAIAEIILGST